ncbi:alpha-ketoglutarate-dependent dioxygenase AlkB [Halomonas sp. PAMB 3264]|uniref:alpha-ketoglutarate-dependent dioxygenase AlkB family protein n=1 Tax=Halomonas sp. PAMB 3264 TaxID=3075222 RepID=UPI00289B33E9|nr:alpha-ketoglutarate-dependent dioxygenase AlkB [Halomonas sp. PAMB 3264]WNL41192.1 alpha-ketoglutarate-dependent dioxygenase AlkB [Halomonas sp. PAMB 3264]
MEQEALFDTPPPANLLPHDGEAFYLGPVLTEREASAYFTRCVLELDWAHERVVMFGRDITTRRKVAWYADAPATYTYSGQTKRARVWPALLQALKERVERASGARFDSCLCNLYHSGEEGMGWHSDDERELAEQGIIASLTLGGERRFSFKHKASGERVSLLLEHGSLLIMQGATQTHWWHSLPKTKKCMDARVNLTFRQLRAG